MKCYDVLYSLQLLEKKNNGKKIQHLLKKQTVRIQKNVMNSINTNAILQWTSLFTSNIFTTFLFTSRTWYCVITLVQRLHCDHSVFSAWVLPQLTLITVRAPVWATHRLIHSGAQQRAHTQPVFTVGIVFTFYIFTFICKKKCNYSFSSQRWGSFVNL